jgi:hypothetical protein
MELRLTADKGKSKLAPNPARAGLLLSANRCATYFKNNSKNFFYRLRRFGGGKFI